VTLLRFRPGWSCNGESLLGRSLAFHDLLLTVTQRAVGQISCLYAGCLPALAVKLRFHLNGRDASVRRRSLRWQDAFIDAMKLYQSDVVDIAFVAAESLQVCHVATPAGMGKGRGHLPTPWKSCKVFRCISNDSTSVTTLIRRIIYALFTKYSSASGGYTPDRYQGLRLWTPLRSGSAYPLIFPLKKIVMASGRLCFTGACLSLRLFSVSNFM